MISVIIPVFQVSDYIERCVLSVLRQTFTEMECIIVDDDTRDDSVKKCEQLIREHKNSIRFSIIHHDKNRGLSAARNTGTNAAKGDYIYYLDSDDEITRDCLERLMEIAKAHPDAEMVIGNHKRYEEGTISLFFDRHITTEYKTNDSIAASFMFQNLPEYAWNKLIKRSFLLEHHLSFIEGIIWEDIPWFFHVNKYLSKLYVCENVTYHHYLRPDSIVTGSSKQIKGKSWIVIIKEIFYNLTSGRESRELNLYSDNFCKCYVENKDDLPEYRFLMRQYKSLALEYRNIGLLIKLYFTCLISTLPFGLCAIKQMKKLKIKMKKNYKRKCQGSVT